MPELKVRERALLESLHRFGVTEEGCIQAWFSLPHSMRIFYVHAYSSKIWNEAVSYRLATYGSRVVEGDLVCLDEDVNDEHFPNSKVSIISSVSFPRVVTTPGTLIFRSSYFGNNLKVNTCFLFIYLFLLLFAHLLLLLCCQLRLNTC